MSNAPIVSLPVPSFSGLNVSVASNTTLSVAAGSAWDSTGEFGLILSSATVLNAATTGLNGLDTGALAASTWYYVFIVGDSSGYNPTGVLLSLSATAPTMPSVSTANSGGYDLLRRVGVALSDGSSHFLVIRQYGNAAVKTCVHNAGISVLSGGAQTSFTAVSLVTAVPPIQNTVANVKASFTPNVAGNAASFSMDGSAVWSDVTGAVAAVVQDSIFSLPTVTVSSAVSTYYKVAASGALTLLVNGFVDYL